MDVDAFTPFENVENDELDIMHAESPPTTPPEVVSTPVTPPAADDSRRSLRPKRSLPNYNLAKQKYTIKLPAQSLKRKASPSSTVENHPGDEHGRQKKAKKGTGKEEKKELKADKKAVCVLVFFSCLLN
jgi:hypothetical protein